MRSHRWFAKAEAIETFTDKQQKHIKELQKAIVKYDFTGEIWEKINQSEELATGVPKEQIYLIPILATRAFKALLHSQRVSKEHARDIVSLRTLLGMLKTLDIQESNIQAFTRKIISFLLLVPKDSLIQSLIGSFDTPRYKDSTMHFYFSKEKGVLQQRYQKALTFVKEKRKGIREPETEALNLCMQRLIDVAYTDSSAEEAVEKSVNREIFKRMLGFRSEVISTDVLHRLIQIIDQNIVDLILGSTSPDMRGKIARYIEAIVKKQSPEKLSNQALEILNKFLVIRLLLPEMLETWCTNNQDKSASIATVLKDFKAEFDELSQFFLSSENKELKLADLETASILSELQRLRNKS